jgi:hypothetical protein
MDAPSVSEPTRAGPDLSVFLVERYIGPSAALELPASVARLARRCSTPTETPTGPLDHVQYLSSAYMPGEDTCFCLFRAADAEAIRALNEAAGFPLDRITPAVLLLPDETGDASHIDSLNSPRSHPL